MPDIGEENLLIFIELSRLFYSIQPWKSKQSWGMQAEYPFPGMSELCYLTDRGNYDKDEDNSN
jgi:hypothetical protein